MADKESQALEFKSDWRDEYLKVISAFANGSGGQLVLGLNDRGYPVGLSDAKRLLEDIPNKIRNRLGIIPAVDLENHKGLDIIRITISPSATAVSCRGKFYLRSGSTVQELSGKDLADFLLRKAGVPWDSAVEEKGDGDILDEQTMEDFRRYASDRIPAIVREENPITILKKLNLIEDNRLKRAAILLFAGDPQRVYSHAVVKIGRFLTDTDIQTTDVVTGNLFRQLESTLETLRTKYLQSHIRYEDIHRRDILEYPYEALREAIINALIHRDYRGSSQIQIRVYPDKLVIMNEGELPPEVPVESLRTTHLSKPRNQLLAGIFYYAGFIEAWGRGTLKIIEKCTEQGLPEPEFSEEHGVMSVIFYKDIYEVEYLKNIGLNERQCAAVEYIKKNKKITNKEYQKLNGVSNKTAYLELTGMADKNIVKIEGGGRMVFYSLK